MDFTIQLQEQEIARADALQSRLRLLDITLYKCQVEGAGPLNATVEPIHMDAELNAELTLRNPSGLDFASTLRVVCDEPAFNISVTFLVRYLFAGRLKTASAGETEAFRKSHAVVAAWPYLREFVQNLAARMGFPTEPMPLLRLASSVAGRTGSRRDRPGR